MACRTLWKVDGTIVAVTIVGDSKKVIDKVFDAIDEKYECIPHYRENRELYDEKFPGVDFKRD